MSPVQPKNMLRVDFLDNESSRTIQVASNNDKWKKVISEELNIVQQRNENN